MALESTPRVEEALAHAQFLRAVARGVLGGDAEVEDVLQETFLVAWREGPRKPSSLRAWLGTVARRLALDRRRSSTRRAGRESAAARPEDLPSPEEIAAREETRQRLVVAVLALEEPYRTTLLWRYYAAKPLAEIALLQDVPVGTVATRLQRGLSRLRERLDAQHRGDRRAWSVLLAPLARAGGAASAVAVLAGGIVVKKLAVAVVLLVAALGGYAVVTKARPEDSRAGAAAPAAARLETASSTDVSDASRATLSTADLPRAPAGAPPATAAWPFTARVLDPEGRPVAKATVEARFLYGDEARTQILMGGHESGGMIASTVTDAEGRFGLDTPSGSFVRDAKGMMVRVVADGFAVRHATLARETEGLIVLGRGGLLSLRATDEAGRAAPGASARVSEGDGDVPTLRGSPTLVVLDATAAENGRMELRLAPGRYRARVRAGGLRPIDTDVLVIEEGRTTERTVRLDPGIVAEFHVVDGAGDPVAGAAAQALGPLASGARGTTDTDGRWRAAGISPPVQGHATGFGPDDRLHFAVDAEGFARFVSWRSLPPGSGAVPVEVRLERGEVVRLRVVDVAGSPVPDATARWLIVPGQGNLLAMEAAGVRAADGRIEMPRVVSGRHRASVAGGDERFERLWKDLEVGSADTEVTVVLARLDGALVGTVLLPDGSPAPEGAVRFEPEPAGEGRSVSGGSTVLEPEGRFRLERLRAGKGDLIVRVPERVEQRFPVDVGPGGSGAEVTLRLRPGKPIAGRVVDRSGAAVAGVSVTLSRLLENVDQGIRSSQIVFESESRAGADGAFSFFAEEGQVYRVGVTDRNWIVMQGAPEDVRAGAEGLVIRVKPSAEGFGMPLRVVATSAGAPYEGNLDVTWMVAGGMWMATGLPADGRGGRRFGISGRPGAYDFTLYAPQHRPTLVRGVEMTESAEGKTLEVALDRGAVVRLRVRDGEGRALADTWVVANGTPVKTDAVGECESSGWPPGSTRFTLPVALASDPIYASAQVAVAGTPSSADVVLRRRGLVTVRLGIPYAALGSDVVLRLVDAKGTIVDEQSIDAARAKEWRGEAYWTLSALADGAHRVVAERGERRGEATVAARVGQTVETTVAWR